jgi:hypothetical protein
MRIPYLHFKWNVMEFGLINAPATYQTLMNTSLAKFINEGFVIVYQLIFTARRQMNMCTYNACWKC